MQANPDLAGSLDDFLGAVYALIQAKDHRFRRSHRPYRNVNHLFLEWAVINDKPTGSTRMYRFRPNEYAKLHFNLSAQEYTGENMTYLLRDTLGEENHRRYVIAQDPLFGGKIEGEIRILTNPDESNIEKFKYRSIGQIQRLG